VIVKVQRWGPPGGPGTVWDEIEAEDCGISPHGDLVLTGEGGRTLVRYFEGYWLNAVVPTGYEIGKTSSRAGLR
jgi:hypothetical protein